MSGVRRIVAHNPNPQSQPQDGAPEAGIQAVGDSNSRIEPTDLRPDPETIFPLVVGWYRASRDHYQEMRQEMAECYDLRAGHQWLQEDLQVLQDQMRPAITFNLVDKFAEAVSGLEINNRMETTYVPRQIGSTGVNDLLTSAAQWVRQECDAEDEETEMFLDTATGGLGCLQTRMDYDEEPDGMGVMERIDPLEMFPDANARKQNLVDARHVLRVKDVPVGAAEELFPDYDPLMLHAQWAEDQPDATRSPHNARLAPYYRIDQSADVDRNEQLIRLVEVEWFEYVKAWRVLDPATGKYVRLSEQGAARYAMIARMMGQRVEMKQDRQRKYWKAIVGAEVLKIMHGPEKGGFSYKFMTGKRDNMKGTWYGIVRAMRDPQLWLNKWVSQGLHIFNTNAKGGLLAETDAFADIDEARDAWAESDSIIELNPGGLNKIQPKQPAQFPQQLNEMTGMAQAMFPQVTGIPQEMMGQSGSQAPQVALMEAGRRQAGMNVLAWLFNSKRRYHKAQGRLLLWMIQQYIADGRLIRIGGPEQAKYVPLVHEPGVAEYDVIVDDAPNSANMKDKVWNALMQLFPMLRGLPIPPQFYISAMKYSPVPASAVEEWTKLLEQPPPPDPVKQAQAALAQARAQSEGARGSASEAAAQRSYAETAKLIVDTHQGASDVESSRAALNRAQEQKTYAEVAAGIYEAQEAPYQRALDVNEQQARIEKIRAEAANALQNAGIAAGGAQMDGIMAAVDALLRSHGAVLSHEEVSEAVRQGQHDRMMEGARFAHEREMAQRQATGQQINGPPAGTPSPTGVAG